ncbi:MAG: hypothetical protein DRR19_11165 [Candidatus Parabeggiatoa sp. nov. 1]|nr:MAG: hypothetical protein DRR19_11165 [Gammaproteobacteria bacterium]
MICEWSSINYLQEYKANLVRKKRVFRFQSDTKLDFSKHKGLQKFRGVLKSSDFPTKPDRFQKLVRFIPLLV